jgi:predicted GH43/DUF377 family glycosyl hydrolase
MNTKRVAVLAMMALCIAGVAFAQTEWVDYPGNPVLEPGPPGSWDGLSRVPGTVLFDGAIYHMWFAGRDQSSGTIQIGHATSPDGLSPWTMDPANPVLTPGAPGGWDELLFSPAPAVIDDGVQYHMWYAGRTPGGIVQGGYATSFDGSVWIKHVDNPVLPVGPPGSWDDHNVRPDTVVSEGETLKMWYSGGDGSTVAIGYAESTDGVHWNKHPSPVLVGSDPPAWDEGVANPTVVFDGSVYHMLYVGSPYSVLDLRVGYAFSTDGIQWNPHRDNPVISIEGDDIYKMPVFFDGSTWHGWYYSESADDERFVFYSTSTCCAGLFGDDFETGDTTLWSVTVP